VAGRCLIVGVLNCTPDSFSDGGRFVSPKEAIEAGVRMAGEGADWIDIGGESTRPGAKTVGEAEEQARVLPVVEGLRARLREDVLVSIDTYRASTAYAALGVGANVVNDISGGLLDPKLLAVAASARAQVVLGHLRGRPSTMMESISFEDVVAEVATELGERIEAARRAGCGGVWADPGIGFGKALEHNLALMRAVGPLREKLGVPVMVGVSRKSFIGQITGRPVGERVFGTAAAVTAAVLAGASAVRVHDVAAMRDVVRVAEALVPASADADA
jgi:dihydropteroate synthase